MKVTGDIQTMRKTGQVLSYLAGILRSSSPYLEFERSED
jgi:hypothetical protein